MNIERMKEIWIYTLIIALFAVVLGFSSYSPAVQAQQPPTLVYGQSGGTIKPLAVDANGKMVIAAGNDPCDDQNASKVSVVINIASATTTQLVAISGTTTIYVCGWSLTAAGTTPTYQWEYGTGASCGTGTTVLTGTYLPIVSAFNAIEVPGTVFKSAAGNAICMVSGGTGPSIQGVLTYVQQ